MRPFKMPPPVTRQAVLNCQASFRMLGYDLSLDEAEIIEVYINALTPILARARRRSSKPGTRKSSKRTQPNRKRFDVQER